MNLIFGNLAGLWALLGIPLVVIIHFLQHQARRYEASTLFLLEHLGQESREGRVFERLRSSAQLWLQLLAVLLLTWLLIQPRWLRTDSFQRVVVLLDSSVSMSAFQEGLAERLRVRLDRFSRAAATTEWRLLESDAGRGSLYAGTELGLLCGQVSGWEPRLGTHDIEPAAKVARSLAGPQGTIVFVTDHVPETELPGVEMLAVGEPVDQCGFTGLRVEGEVGAETWQALVRNYGTMAAERRWRTELGGQAVQEATLEIAPGETRLLRGEFPPDESAFSLVLEPDRFVHDDRLPVLRPQPKRLSMSLGVGDDLRPTVEKLLGSLRHIDVVARSQSPDVEVYAYAPGILPDIKLSRLCLPSPSDAGSEPSGQVVAEAHSLTDGLSWQGLLCRPVDVGPVTDRDQVLVWQGERPLLMLRRAGEVEQLVVGFDVPSSNADRLPAFVVVVHRFVERLRAAKRAPEARNVEVNQRLAVAMNPEGGELVLREARGGESAYSLRQASLLRAPRKPGHFTVEQGEETLLRGSARFADTREADLRHAVSQDGLQDRAELIQVKNTRPDALAPLWTAALALALLASWAVPGRQG